MRAAICVGTMPAAVSDAFTLLTVIPTLPVDALTSAADTLTYVPDALTKTL